MRPSRPLRTPRLGTVAAALALLACVACGDETVGGQLVDPGGASGSANVANGDGADADGNDADPAGSGAAQTSAGGAQTSAEGPPGEVALDGPPEGEGSEGDGAGGDDPGESSSDDTDDAPSVACPTAAPTPAPGQPFVIESIRFDRNQVTVRNVSGEDQVVSFAWRWCDFPHYGLLVELDDTVVPAGEAISFETAEGARVAEGGEMGLYRSDAYVEPDDLLAYVSWGTGTSRTGPSEREPIASMAGVWTFGERVSVPADAIGLVATGESDRAAGYTPLPAGCE